MAGGLLNLIAVGNQNVIINGNPSKTFFKVTYAKHTNFGLQKFKIDYEGNKNIHPEYESQFKFKIPRYGDLIMDTHLVFKLPSIWSPVVIDDQLDYFGYEFQWIKNIGTQMIKEVTITIGGQIVQKYSGDYIQCLAERDYTSEKKRLFDEMTGNVVELHNPAKYHGSSRDLNKDYYTGRDVYPNTIYKKIMREGEEPEELTPHPSILGRYLYIPLNAFWCNTSKCALPLVSLEYHELEVSITIRPMKELYTIVNTERDISGSYLDGAIEKEDVNYSLMNGNNHLSGEYKALRRVAPDFNEPKHRLRWFIYPTDRVSNNDDFEISHNMSKYYNNESGLVEWNNKRETWNTEIHLISTYAFLSEEEAEVFTSTKQEYLYKDVKEHKFQDMYNNRVVELETSSLVSGWMFRFQRDDMRERNEWSNYTNITCNSENEKQRYLDITYDLSLNFNTGLVSSLSSQPILNSYGIDDTTNRILNGSGTLRLDQTDVLSNISAVRKEYYFYNERRMFNYGDEARRGNDIGSNDSIISNSTQINKYNSDSQANGRNNRNKTANFGITINNSYNQMAEKSILRTMGILLDGKYRENLFERGIYDYLEKFRTNSSSSCDGLYCYNFSVLANHQDTQPSGAINLSKFKKIQLELSLIEPLFNPNHFVSQVCTAGNLTGIVDSEPIYSYAFELIVYEERYNILELQNGMANLLFSR